MKQYSTPELMVHGTIASLTLMGKDPCKKDLPPGKIRDFPADAFCARSKS